MLQQGPQARGKLLPPGYLQNQLISRGVRMTRQRRVILTVIENARGHLDAAAILQFAREADEGIDRVTVYRTLKLLKRHHLIDELDLLHLEGGGHFYEQRPLSEHMHLACLRCGRVTEFSSALFDRIKGQIQRDLGFRVDFARIEIGGHCESCQEELTH
jgi:Fur family transcriptional regulator, ferric uptake regulator